MDTGCPQLVTTDVPHTNKYYVSTAKKRGFTKVAITPFFGEESIMQFVEAFGRDNVYLIRPRGEMRIFDFQHRQFAKQLGLKNIEAGQVGHKYCEWWHKLAED